MNVLYVTYNSHLRNTTRMLDAFLAQSSEVRPTLLFSKPGPWQQAMRANGIPTYFANTTNAINSIPSALSTAAKVSWIVLRHKIDLIHCNEHDHYPLLRRIAHTLSIPIVVTCRFVLHEKYTNWMFSPPFQPSALQFTSEFSRTQVISTLPNLAKDIPNFVVMNGLNVDNFLKLARPRELVRRELNLNESMEVLGTAGAIHPRKGILDFVSLIGSLRKAGRNAVGLIAGFEEKDKRLSRVYRDEIENRIHELGLSQQVFFVGPYNEMASFLGAIDLYVSTAEIETFGMSVCEAMACGTPVVVYDVGSLAEILPTAASQCLVRHGDIQRMADVASHLLESPRGNWQLLAEHVKSSFDSLAVARRQNEVYHAVVS